MAKSDKLIARFKSRPADFEWVELVKMLNGFGYEQKSGAGSRYTFDGDGLPKLKLHRPHPGSIVKRYVLKQVQEVLEAEGLI